MTLFEWSLTFPFSMIYKETLWTLIEIWWREHSRYKEWDKSKARSWENSSMLKDWPKKEKQNQAIKLTNKQAKNNLCEMEIRLVG